MSANQDPEGRKEERRAWNPWKERPRPVRVEAEQQMAREV